MKLRDLALPLLLSSCTAPTVPTIQQPDRKGEAVTVDQTRQALQGYIAGEGSLGATIARKDEATSLKVKYCAQKPEVRELMADFNSSSPSDILQCEKKRQEVEKDCILPPCDVDYVDENNDGQVEEVMYCDQRKGIEVKCKIKVAAAYEQCHDGLIKAAEGDSGHLTRLLKTYDAGDKFFDGFVTCIQGAEQDSGYKVFLVGACQDDKKSREIDPTRFLTACDQLDALVGLPPHD